MLTMSKHGPTGGSGLEMDPNVDRREGVVVCRPRRLDGSVRAAERLANTVAYEARAPRVRGVLVDLTGSGVWERGVADVWADFTAELLDRGCSTAVVCPSPDDARRVARAAPTTDSEEVTRSVGTDRRVATEALGLS